MKDALLIEEFNYNLPLEVIAQTAIEPRDSSKLLVYKKGKIEDDVFSNLHKILPKESSLFFNNAKVIPARIFAKNSNGAKIEIFLLKPYLEEHLSALSRKAEGKWECMIGNSKKWNSNEVLTLDIDNTNLFLERISESVVYFKWNGDKTFVELLENIGNMPLPPYIKHLATEIDSKRYQTVYSKIEGSVAAPTAGLHFTDATLRALEAANHTIDYLTLHIGAGTFMPVKVEDALDHPMHTEIFSIEKSSIEHLLKQDYVVSVGTTSCRVLESLYWYSVNILQGAELPGQINQFIYKDSSEKKLPSRKESIAIVLDYMVNNDLENLQGETSILIAPGYKFRMIDGMITNFHQPKSTLLLLISAFIGEDWKKVYKHAIDLPYRFLSYGDSSLLLP
jgi:S-adenosylmethionine:tRNA ribosyltransferase-isomerase